MADFQTVYHFFVTSWNYSYYYWNACSY